MAKKLGSELPIGPGDPTKTTDELEVSGREGNTQQAELHTTVRMGVRMGGRRECTWHRGAHQRAHITGSSQRGGEAHLSLSSVPALKTHIKD